MKFPSREFDDTVAAACHGTASDTQLTDLGALLSADLGALDEYILRVELHSRLAVDVHHHFNNHAPALPASDDRARAQILPSQLNVQGKSPVLGFLGAAMQLSASWLASPKVLALTVVGCLGTYFLGLMISIAVSRAFLTDRQAQERADSPPAAPARIIAAAGCRWEDRAPRADLDGKLPAGTSRLAEGFVELEFDGGARIRVEGPAEFAPRTGQRIELAQGRLMAYVPKQARGFIVVTPSAELIDLGTEFGVEVDSQGATDLHVIRGRVEMKSVATTAAGVVPAGRKQQVVAGQAVRISAGSDVAIPIPLDLSRFETGRAIVARSIPRGTALGEPWPERQPIWLSNLFDDVGSSGKSLADAMDSDYFRARAEPESLGVERVFYAGRPVKEIAPGVNFDARNLGWQDIAYAGGRLTNDAWADAHHFADENGTRGGIRTQGRPMGYNEPRIEEGIGQHANALITFDLDEIRAAGGLAGRALEFRCDRAGINDACLKETGGSSGSVHMVVLVSGARHPAGTRRRTRRGSRPARPYLGRDRTDRQAAPGRRSIRRISRVAAGRRSMVDVARVERQ